jgi:excisionase family DNA binding protein
MIIVHWSDKIINMKTDELKKDTVNIEMPLLMNMHEAASALGICYRSIQNLVYSRRIGFVQIGKNYKFRPKDLNEFVEKNYIKPVR